LDGERAALHSNLPYITWNALGKAILLAQAKQFQVEEANGEVTDPMAYKELIEFLGIDPQVPLPNHHVVLIDEIDKTPRDFPNDLLFEFEKLVFRVPELKRTFKAPSEYRPVLLLTSNSEKSLPDPFLRRCCYHHIEFPGPELLGQIFATKVPALAGNDRTKLSPLLESALAFLASLRADGRLTKLPATAEMLDWLEALRARGAQADKPLAAQLDTVKQTLHLLGKNSNDQKVVSEHAKKTLAPDRSPSPPQS
jgi:MoxR-like ATPase